MHIAPGRKRKVGTATYANPTWEKNLAARLCGAVGIGGSGVV